MRHDLTAMLLCGTSAEAAGDRSKASLYARKLLGQAKDADTDRPELAWARTRG